MEQTIEKKRFLKNSIVYLLIFCLLFAGLCLLSAVSPFREWTAQLTDTQDYLSHDPSHEILVKLEKVKQQPDASVLLIGDSVCNHLFAPYEKENPDYVVAAGNRGLGMGGQYVLTEQFLETHPGADRVCLLITTNSLITGYETQFGYQYAVLPFLETDTLSLMDPESLAEMKKTYGSFVTNKEAALLVENSPILKKLYLNLLNTYRPSSVKAKIPDTVVRNILRMEKLCREKGVDFYLVPAPVADTPERRDLEQILQKEFESSALMEVFPDYYDNLSYYPAGYFSDGVHPDAASGMIPAMIADIRTNYPCLADYAIE